MIEISANALLAFISALFAKADTLFKIVDVYSANFLAEEASMLAILAISNAL